MKIVVCDCHQTHTKITLLPREFVRKLLEMMSLQIPGMIFFVLSWISFFFSYSSHTFLIFLVMFVVRFLRDGKTFPSKFYKADKLWEGRGGEKLFILTEGELVEMVWKIFSHWIKKIDSLKDTFKYVIEWHCTYFCVVCPSFHIILDNFQKMSTSGILIQLRDCKIDAERRWSSCKVKNGNVHKIGDFRGKTIKSKKKLSPIPFDVEYL